MADKKAAPLTDAQKAAKKAEREKSMAEKFITLARKRVTNAQKAIALVGQLGNRASYRYDDAQAAKIGKALDLAVDQAKGRYVAGAKDETSGFDF